MLLLYFDHLPKTCLESVEIILYGAFSSNKLQLFSYTILEDCLIDRHQTAVIWMLESCHLDDLDARKLYLLSNKIQQVSSSNKTLYIWFKPDVYSKHKPQLRQQLQSYFLTSPSAPSR